MKFEAFKCGPPRSIMGALGPQFLGALETAPNYGLLSSLLNRDLPTRLMLTPASPAPSVRPR